MLLGGHSSVFLLQKLNSYRESCMAQVLLPMGTGTNEAVIIEDVYSY